MKDSDRKFHVHSLASTLQRIAGIFQNTRSSSGSEGRPSSASLRQEAEEQITSEEDLRQEAEGEIEINDPRDAQAILEL